jgi:hypothetical protein
MDITTVKLIYEGVLMFNYVPHHNDVWSSILPHILGTIIYLQKLPTQFVVCQCLSVCPHVSAQLPTEQIFVKFCI